MVALLKKESEYVILKQKIKHYTKEIIKYCNIIAVAAILILIIVMMKYKPLYKVTVDGETVGYIENKEQLEAQIEEIKNPEAVNIAFVDITKKPEFEFKLIEKSQETNADEIVQQISDTAIRTYRQYAITLNGEQESCVDTLEEAEEIVAEMKENYKEDKVELELAINEVFTQNAEDIQTVTLAMAKDSLNSNIREIVAEEKKRQESTIAGVYMAVKPVTGHITSRFGSFESIRSHAHSGLDIAAPSGTPIYAAADGKISYAKYNSGGYGNLIIIDHGNGVKTYYGHCSKLYASVGETVKAGDKIAAVGTTGFSTGNHLHFEIRLNDKRVNPQQYIYK